MKEVRKGNDLIIREKTAALLNPQDGKAITFYSEKLQLFCEFRLGQTHLGAELFYPGTDYVLGVPISVYFHAILKPSQDEV